MAAAAVIAIHNSENDDRGEKGREREREREGENRLSLVRTTAKCKLPVNETVAPKDMESMSPFAAAAAAGSQVHLHTIDSMIEK